MLEPHRTTVGRVARWGCGIEGGTSGTGEVVIVVGKSREGHEHGSLEVVVRLHEFDGREVLSPLDGVVDEVVAVAFDAVDEMGEQEDVGKEEESEGGLGTVEVGHRGVARRERGEDDQGQATPHAFAVHALLLEATPCEKPFSPPELVLFSISPTRSRPLRRLTRRTSFANRTRLPSNPLSSP